jgi:23S rRNA pseudouridine2605 synthase
MAQERLQKVLAAAGIDSRRKCEELILDGLVRVNGKVVDTLPAFVDPEKDAIIVNGRRLKPAEKVYYLFNKPKSVICTNFDPEGRKKAIDFIDTPHRIFCVGRLDADTTGLVILTNDSELTNRLTHPSYELPKSYIVDVEGIADGPCIEKLKNGVWLSEGKTGRASVKVLQRNQKASMLEITIRQGLNRQIRRMFAKIGLKVKSLKRVKIGKIDAKGLGVGKYRKLSIAEITYLRNATLVKNDG